jgi:Phage stabilisation protein
MAVQMVPFAAQSYRARSVALDAQRVVNFYAEAEPKEAKSPVAVWGCPGMVAFAQCGDGPIHGMGMMGGAVYVVSGQTLYRVNADGSSVALGATAVTGPVSMDTNGVDLVWVDGEAGWSYSVAGGVQQIVDPNFYPADSVVYFDTYFVFNRSGTQEFFLSPQMGVTPFDGTMFASKEATPDPLLAIVNSHEQLYLFGAARTEIWYDAGNAPPTFPFQRFDGAFIQRGIAGPHAKCLEDNTVFFLGDDGMFYRLNGFQPERISTHATEGAWQSYSTMSDARCFSYTLEGHKFVNLLFPGASASWVFDVATGLWHERESWTGGSEDSSIGRWRVNTAVMAFNRVLVGDCLTGIVGQLNYQVYTELGATMRGLIVAPPIQDVRRRVFMRRFELDVETGIGLPAAASIETVTYQPQGILLVAPGALTHEGAPSGMAGAMITLLVNLWAYLPDDGAQRGVLVGNAETTADSPGFSILLVNDDTAPTAQIVISASDSQGHSIVSASYAYTDWASWVNVQISLFPAAETLQLYVAGAALTPASITWGSQAPIGNPAGQDWVLAPSTGPDVSPGVVADPAFGGHTAGTGTGWLNTSAGLDQFGNMISVESYLMGTSIANVNAVSQAGGIAWTLLGTTIQSDALSQIPSLSSLLYAGTPSVLLGGQYLAVGVWALSGNFYAGVSIYRINNGSAPTFLGLAYCIWYDPGSDGRCFLAGNQTINDPILMMQEGGGKKVFVFPSIAQIIGGAAKSGGLDGLYPDAGNTASWASCQVPFISYAYPAALGANLLVQYGYGTGGAGAYVGFFLPDGSGGTNHYLYLSRGDMAANDMAGINTNDEILNVIGPDYPNGAMVKIAMGAISYDALVAAYFAGNANTSFAGTLPMYSIDNANWVNEAGTAQIPFTDEYSYIATGQPGGTDVYGGRPGLTPIPGTSQWLVSFLLVGQSDSQANRGNATLWDTVRVFRYSGGTATQVGIPVSGEAYSGATNWTGYELPNPGDGQIWSDRNATAYVVGNDLLIYGNMYGDAEGSYPSPGGAQYCTRFGTLNLPLAQVADLFIAAPTAFFNLASAANRALFRSAGGGAQYLAADGSIPLGESPPVFLTVNPGATVADFPNNGGSGGAFALSGQIVAAESNPPGGTYQEAIAQPANTPVGADPQIMLDWSDDGARTWSALRLCRSMGMQGAYLTRLRWLKLGQARQRVLRLQVTDPVRRNLIGFYLDTDSGMD